MTEPQLIPEPNGSGVCIGTPASSSSRWKGPLFAVLLSLFIHGLGQLRNRQPGKGLLIGAASTVLLILAGYAQALSTFKGMIVYLAVGILWSLFICVDAFRYARRGRESRKTFQQAKTTFLVCGVLIATFQLIDTGAYFLHKFGYFRAFKVPSASMCPTICEGDRIVADMNAFLKSGPRRGDIILMKHATSQALFIKRVIGVEGDIVSVRPGEISVNGQPLVEPKRAEGCGGTGSKPRPYDDLELYGDVKVPESSFFVVGDNLAHSFDSRFRGFGIVRSSQVRGRPQYIYWSPNSSRIGCSIR
jgi:signal peptidase I